MERFGTDYLEERKLVQRWPQPIPAIVALVLTLAVFYATWWILPGPPRLDAHVHPLRRLHVHALVADHADLDGLYLQLLAVQAQLAGKHSPARQGSRPHGDLGRHPVGSHQGLLRVASGQFRDRLLQPRQPDEAAQDDGVLRPRVRIAGLP